MVGDGTWLTVSEAAHQLGISATTIRDYIRDDLLYAWTTNGGHRRIDPDTVDQLSRALRGPRDQRETALARIRTHVRARLATEAGDDESGPAPAEGTGPQHEL